MVWMIQRHVTRKTFHSTANTTIRPLYIKMNLFIQHMIKDIKEAAFRSVHHQNGTKA
jgi:hypothetical protein